MVQLRVGITQRPGETVKHCIATFFGNLALGSNRAASARCYFASYFVALVLVTWLGYLVLEAVLAFARWPRAELTPAKREEIS